VRKANSPFLKSSVHYQLPSKFDCNVLDNVMAFVLHVPNVQPDSIEQLREQRSLHLQFATIGSGYYPTHYAFYVELPAENEASAIESVEAEAWDNNVVLKLSLSSQSETPDSYLAGLDATDLMEYPVHGQYNVKDKGGVNTKKEIAPLDVKFERSQEGQALKVTIRPGAKEEEQEEDDEHQDHDQENEQQHQQQGQNKKPGKKQRKRNKKERSFSESACDDMVHVQEPVARNPEPQPNPTFKLPSQRKQRSYSECNDSTGGNHRGILKRFSRYGPRPSISDSCSSIDDCSSYSCSVDASGTSLFSHSFGGIPEDTDELDAKLHVTVPRSLVVEIELPLLRSTAECQLDVTSKSVYLFSERQGAKYRLKLDLPFTVDDKAGRARFDTDLRRLCITLPVVRKSVQEQGQMHDTLRHFSREDSGVELHSNSESPVEEDPDGELSDSKADISEIGKKNFLSNRNSQDKDESIDTKKLN